MAFLHFKSQYEKKLNTSALHRISKKTYILLLKAFWCLTAPTGKMFLTFKNKTDLTQDMSYLIANSYRVNLNYRNKHINVIVHNIDRNQDDISFEKQLKAIISIADCYFERQSVIIFLLIICNVKILFKVRNIKS